MRQNGTKQWYSHHGIDLIGLHLIHRYTNIDSCNISNGKTWCSEEGESVQCTRCRRMRVCSVLGVGG